MISFLFNVVLSAVVIGVVVWLAGRSPSAAGFAAVMPLSAMLILPLSRAKLGGAGTALLAKSMLLGIPTVAVFILPFIAAGRLRIGFWQAYALGCALMLPAFALHRYLFKLWL
ncbi:MAG: hypothetical protein HY552_02340 [Elusimicrobia bacterium]|nr:hypothetical protein [Elusimicrobiota bacterium]